MKWILFETRFYLNIQILRHPSRSIQVLFVFEQFKNKNFFHYIIKYFVYTQSHKWRIWTHKHKNTALLLENVYSSLFDYIYEHWTSKQSIVEKVCCRCSWWPQAILCIMLNVTVLKSSTCNWRLLDSFAVTYRLSIGHRLFLQICYIQITYSF